jgi:hypothetical protein
MRGQSRLLIAVLLALGASACDEPAFDVSKSEPTGTKALAGSAMGANASVTAMTLSNDISIDPVAISDAVWLARIGSTNENGVEEVARAVDFDGRGGLFAAGTLAAQSNLSTSQGGSLVSLGGYGGADGFIAATVTDGRPRWAVVVGGSGDDYVYDVAHDGRGGAWACGSFVGAAIFGSFNLAAQGSASNGFAAHVSANGVVDRVIHIGPSAGVIPGECVVDSQGGLYVSGSYSGAPAIGGVALPPAPRGQGAGFVVAYDTSGRVRWVRGVVATSTLAWRGIAIAEDGSEDLIGIGQFRGTTTIGSTTITSTGGQGASTWVARWSASGSPLWAVSPAGESYGRGVRAMGDDIVASGAFRTSLAWPGLASTAGIGGQDIFAVRLTGTGNAVWSRAIGGAFEDEGAEIATDGARNVYLAGSLSGTATIGASSLRTSGARDMLIARLDSAGNPLEARLVGGVSDDAGYAIEANLDGMVAYGGFARSRVSDGEHTLRLQGGYDAVFGLFAGGASATTASSGAKLSALAVSQSVTIPQRGGGTLSARIFAPNTSSGPYPAISMLPGGGAPIDSVVWAASGLADAGYVVIVTQPSSGGSLSAYNTAAISGIDYLRSSNNPYAAITSAEKVGVAGWSLGARALSRTQEEDARIDALVAWDNLAVIESGDVGAPNCRGTVPSSRRTPRVPAMGQASDYCGPPNETVEDKKYAYEWWRSNSQPTMQVVFENSDHFVWGTQGNGSAKQGYALYYTKAWFDRWLKGDTNATSRLLARTINGQPISSVLSDRFRSAASFDSRNCPNLRASCN